MPAEPEKIDAHLHRCRLELHFTYLGVCLIHRHPHIRTFIPLPKLADETFLKLWEHEVFKLFLSTGKTIEEVILNMRSAKNVGFKVVAQRCYSLAIPFGNRIWAKGNYYLERTFQGRARLPTMLLKRIFSN